MLSILRNLFVGSGDLTSDKEHRYRIIAVNISLVALTLGFATLMFQTPQSEPQRLLWTVLTALSYMIFVVQRFIVTNYLSAGYIMILLLLTPLGSFFLFGPDVLGLLSTLGIATALYLTLIFEPAISMILTPLYTGVIVFVLTHIRGYSPSSNELFGLSIAAIFITFYVSLVGWRNERQRRIAKASADQNAADKADMDSLMHNVPTGQGVVIVEDDGPYLEEIYSRELLNLTGGVHIFSQRFEYFLQEIADEDYLDVYLEWLELLFTHKNFNRIRKMMRMERVFTKIPHPKIKGMNRVLSFDFAKTEDWSQKNRRYIFSVIDVTDTVRRELKKEREEKQRTSELEKIQQILATEPAILLDYIQDSKSAIDEISGFNRNQNNDYLSSMEHAFAKLHAIKGNGALMGLQGFAETVHEVESAVKAAMDPNIELTEDEQQTNILDITFKTAAIIQELEIIEALIDKIRGWGLENSSERSDTGYLHLLIEKSVEQMATKHHKNISVDLNNFNSHLYPQSYRSAIRDISSQLIRNAIAHAFAETDSGRIQVESREKEDVFQIVFSDDGAGIDFEKVASRGIEKGLITRDQASDKKILMNLIFKSGISTQNHVDADAGRGAGLNLVKILVEQYGGHISVNTNKGKGTRFTISLPKVLENEGVLV
jgi:two-component system chemotaxis sensor kinase CheA